MRNNYLAAAMDAAMRLMQRKLPEQRMTKRQKAQAAEANKYPEVAHVIYGKAGSLDRWMRNNDGYNLVPCIRKSTNTQVGHRLVAKYAVPKEALDGIDLNTMPARARRRFLRKWHREQIRRPRKDIAFVSING